MSGTFVVLFSWLRAREIWSVPIVVGMILSLYCVGHVLFLLAVLGGEGNARIGFGSILALFCGLGFLGLSIKAWWCDEASARSR